METPQWAVCVATARLHAVRWRGDALPPGGHPACAPPDGAAHAHIRRLADSNPHTGGTNPGRYGNITRPILRGLLVSRAEPGMMGQLNYM